MSSINSIFLDLVKTTKPIFEAGFKDSVKFRLKEHKDFVTSTDIAVCNAINCYLTGKGYEKAEIISEEKEYVGDPMAQKRVWIIDPLDGTREFVYRIPEFALSIYFENRRSGKRAAMIFNPINGFLISCDEELNVSGHSDLALASFVLCSRSEEKKGLMSQLQSRLETKSVGSIAYKLGLVAAGLARAVISYKPKNSWDVAAGFELVKQSGGKVYNWEQKEIIIENPLEQVNGGFIAIAHDQNHDHLFSIARECNPDFLKS